MPITKKYFRQEASRLRGVRNTKTREVQIKSAVRIYKQSNPRFSEKRFRDFVKYGTENKKSIAKWKKGKMR